MKRTTKPITAQASWEQECIGQTTYYNLMKPTTRKHTRWHPTIIKCEAQLYLKGFTIPAIADKLGIPLSTVSWHLIHPLEKIDYKSWIAIRYRLLHKAKNTRRRDYEEAMIEVSGLSEELYHQWDAIDEERRKKKK